MSDPNPAPAREGSALGWLLPIALGLCAAIPASPWFGVAALLAAPLFLLAAGSGLDWKTRFRRHLRDRYWYYLAPLIVLGAALAWPAQTLWLDHANLPAALTLSALLGIALVLAWRRAALPAHLENSTEAENPLARARDELLETGDAIFLTFRPWSIAAALLALAVSTLACAWHGPWPSPQAHLAFTALHSVLLAPLLATYAIRTGSRWLIEARERQAREEAALTAQEAASEDTHELPVETPAISAPPPDGVKKLYAAATSGRVDEALHLLEMGVDPHALPEPDAKDQRTLLMLASLQGDLRLLRALIAARVDVNRAHAGLTPLLAAVRDSYHGRPDTVLMLLTNGADPRVADADGETPLHRAARGIDPGVAALLLDAGAPLEALDKQGFSPLGIACATGNLPLAAFLLEHRAKPEPPNGQPALLAAAGNPDDDPAMVKLLLKHKAKIDARGRLERSALHVAALAGNAEIAQTLLAAGADVNARDAQNVTPLLEAARAGSVATIRVLAKHSPDLEAEDSAGRNALAIACQATHPDASAISALLELGVDRHHRGADGRLPIDYAVAAGRWSHVLLLDPDYTIPASLVEDDDQLLDAPPKVRLRLALERERLDTARALLAKDSPVVVFERDAEGNAELTAFFFDIYPRLTQYALRVLADAMPIESIDAEGMSLLAILLAQGSEAAPAIRALLDRGASPAGAGLLSLFLANAMPGDAQAENLALELLERGADPFGGAPLAQAVRLGFNRLLDALLARGVNPDARNANGATTLLLACERGDEHQVKQLILHGAQPAARTSDGQTALGYTLEHGLTHLRKWLEWPQWPLPRRPLRPGDLIAAARLGDASAVRNLLELGLPCNAVDSLGCTALLRACGGGHLAVVQLLLQHDADASLPANSGATCLSAALSSRNLPIVSELLAHGVPADQRLPGGVTALMVAAALGQTRAVRALLAAGADPRAVDTRGGSVAHAAAQYGFTATDTSSLLDLWGVLDAAGADLDGVNASGETPLLLLLGAGFEPGTPCREDTVLAQVQLLGSHGVNLLAQDKRGFGPLHLAALHGLGRVVRALIDLGANPEQRDTINRRPSEIALMRGFVDIAHEFAPAKTPPSIARFLREPKD